MRLIIILVLLIATSCNDSVETVTYDTKSDTTERSIDQSGIIDDSSRLPKDSSNTGVQH